MHIYELITFIFSIICFLISIFGFIGFNITIFYWYSLIHYDFPFKENNNSEALNLYYSIIITILISILFYLSVIIAISTEFTCEESNISSILTLVSVFLAIFQIISLIFILFYSTNSKCQIIHQKGTYYGQNTSKYIKWYSEYSNIPLLEFKKMRCENRSNILNLTFFSWISTIITLPLCLCLIYVIGMTYGKGK